MTDTIAKNNEATQFSVPVLFLVFNRPDVTVKVFERIRQIRPERLYVAADGPRNEMAGEDEVCQQVRRIATNVDWPCDVHTLFREKNLGLRAAVSGALNWFFEIEPEGIILEDDCLPSMGFFIFCRDLLDRYRDDDRVMSVSGVNFQFGAMKTPYSYYFSRYNHCWGWASWRNGWKHYDDQMSVWPEARNDGRLIRILNNKNAVQYWTEAFNKAYEEQVDSWAYRWTLSMWLQNGLAILPAGNLVSNIGFGEKGTHTKGKDLLADVPVEKILFPLNHPPAVAVDDEADHRTFVTCFSPTLHDRIGRRIRRIFKRE